MPSDVNQKDQMTDYELSSQEIAASLDEKQLSSIELPRSPFAFCVRYLKIYALVVGFIVIFEAGH